jgi:hypothetical protein
MSNTAGSNDKNEVDLGKKKEAYEQTGSEKLGSASPNSGDAESAVDPEPSFDWIDESDAKNPQINRIPCGYQDVAYMMAKTGSPFAIFRKFGQLNMLSLLGLQAELLLLQNKYRAHCQESARGAYGERAKQFAYSFNELMMSQEDVKEKIEEERSENPSADERPVDLQQLEPDLWTENEKYNDQYKVLLEIREKLKEYSL